MTPLPSRGRMLWRGATRRCPRCGRGRLFTRWFTMVPDCPRCGMHYEREQGYWVGAVAVNFTIVAFVFVLVMTIFMGLTLPDIPVASLLMTLVPLMLFGPAIIYPYSKTLWVAIDLAFLHHL
jgi:uncharacterized protein (DUF983 family)